MSETNEKHSRLTRLGRWLAELILVFVGIYAAFWLNNLQTTVSFFRDLEKTQNDLLTQIQAERQHH
jgi:hypothetical protein